MITKKLVLFVFLGMVTVVWIVNFAVCIMDSMYDGSQINNIFMTIVGSGILVKALLDKASNDDGGLGQE